MEKSDGSYDKKHAKEPSKISLAGSTLSEKVEEERAQSLSPNPCRSAPVWYTSDKEMPDRVTSAPVKSKERARSLSPFGGLKWAGLSYKKFVESKQKSPQTLGEFMEDLTDRSMDDDSFAGARGEKPEPKRASAPITGKEKNRARSLSPFRGLQWAVPPSHHHLGLSYKKFVESMQKSPQTLGEFMEEIG